MTIREKYAKMYPLSLTDDGGLKFSYCIEKDGMRFMKQFQCANLTTAFKFVTTKSGKDYLRLRGIKILQVSRAWKKVYIRNVRPYRCKQELDLIKSDDKDWAFRSIMTRLVVDNLEMMTPIIIEQHVEKDKILVGEGKLITEGYVYTVQHCGDEYLNYDK